MKRFLKETWELWYWAMFCPSKLQQRMNEWSPQIVKETAFSDILATFINWRFTGQVLLIICCFSLPLLGFLTASSTSSSWILLPTVLVSSYGVAFLFLPVGLHIPLLLSLVYGAVPQIVDESLALGLQTLQESLPPISQVFIGIAVGSLVLGLSSAGIYASLVRNRLMTARFTLVYGSSAAVFVGSWISTQAYFLTLLLGIVAAFSLYFFRGKLNTDKNSVGIAVNVAVGVAFDVAVIVAVIVASGVVVIVASSVADAFAVFFALGVAFGFANAVVLSIAFGFANAVAVFFASGITSGIAVGGIVGVTVVFSFGVAIVFGIAFAVIVTSGVVFVFLFGVAGGVASVGQLPLAVFLLTTALLSFSCSYTRRRWLGCWLSAVLVTLGFEQLGLSILWVVPVALAFYYRVVPEYFFFAPISFSSTLSFLNRKKLRDTVRQQTAALLRRLPPFSSELVWLSIPRHETLLAKVFYGQPSFGLQALQAMQTSPLPGLQRTSQQALPLILTDYLSRFRDIASFQQLTDTTEDAPTNTPDPGQSNNLLSVLLPNFYSVPSDDVYSTSPLPTAELTAILPRLRNIAQDTDAALQASNLALQERGLESVLKRLEMLPSQLPSLGLTTKAIQRWNTVIQRWQNILKLELAEQKKRSQGELLNPFQYGNPLQRNRADLFKGRQTFAENIARILLDRNRPTIVLHGPRRCGKTSFLNNLPRLLPSQWIPVFIDAQSAATTTDEAAFCQSLVRAIIRDGRIQGVKFPVSPTRPEFLSAPYVILENWLQVALDDLKKTDKDKRLLLTIDEFEKIGTAIDAGKLSTDLFDELRSLIQHWEQLGFVFSGVQTLTELGPNWSSYFISVVPVEMLYLKPHEAEELLINPDPDFSLTYAPGLIDEILQLTQCHPNLVQLIGAALVTEANECHTTIATPDMLQAAIPRAFTLGTAYFDNVWSEFTGNPQNPAEVQRGQTLLKALSQGIHPPVEADELTKSALRRMERYHVLKAEASQYAFDIPLIQRWVKERAILE